LVVIQPELGTGGRRIAVHTSRVDGLCILVDLGHIAADANAPIADAILVATPLAL